MTKSIETLMQDETFEQTSACSSWDNIIEKTSKKTGEYLISKAKKQLSQILFESKQIQETQSRLKLVKQRYNLQKSTLSSIGDWYAERPFWQKLAIATAIIGATVVAGLFVHAALTALFAAVAIGFCLAAHITLEEHAASTAICHEKLCEDLENLEKKLGQRIESIRVLEDKLKSTFLTLASTNVRLAEDEARLMHEITELGNQIEALKSTNQNAQSITETLKTLNDSLILKLTHAQNDIDNLRTKMREEATMMSHTNHRLAHTGKEIHDEVVEIKHVGEGFEQSFQRFNHMIDGLEQQTQSQQNATPGLDVAINNANKLMREIDAYYGTENQCRNNVQPDSARDPLQVSYSPAIRL